MRRPPYLLIPILLLAAVTLCLVPPAGDFPLNDDWVYGKMVQRLASDGALHVHPYAQAYAFVQALWALPFVKIFGFSFTVLRISTLLLAVVAVWGVALCGRELGFSRRTSLACAAVVFCNPLFLNLSYTFMSDVPFVCALVFSCLYFLKALRTGSPLYILAGSAIAAVGFFNRQFAALIAAAFAVAAILWMIRCRRGAGLRSVLAFVGPWAVAGLLVLYLHAAGQRIYTPPHAAMRGLFDNLDPGRLAVLAISIALTMGLFLTPIGAGMLWRYVRSPGSRTASQLFAAAMAAGLLALGLLRDRRPLPRFPNILRDFGVGPILLQDTYSVWKPWSPFSAPPAVLWVIAGFALLSAALCIGGVIGIVFRRSRSKQTATPLFCRRLQYTFLLVLGALLVLAPCNSRTVVYFDRYLVPAIVPFALVAAGALPVRARQGLFRPVAFACALLYVFSIAGLHDYLAWNRARWEAIAFLRTDLGARDNQIDGGYEFNGMYTSDEFVARSGDDNIGNQGEKGWWVIDDTYKVAMTSQDQYVTVERFPYFSWLGFETREMLALARRSPSPQH